MIEGDVGRKLMLQRRMLTVNADAMSILSFATVDSGRVDSLKRAG
jgi:hypothetical protein